MQVLCEAILVTGGSSGPSLKVTSSLTICYKSGRLAGVQPRGVAFGSPSSTICTNLERRISLEFFRMEGRGPRTHAVVGSGLEFRRKADGWMYLYSFFSADA